MHLRQLDLRNFRSFAQETVFFEIGLTVLVGENNGGKSNIIDALRLLSIPLNGRRELFCEETDIRFGTEPLAFELCATYEGLTPPQQGRLLSATTDDTLEEACFGLTYRAEDTKVYVRPSLWAGRFRSQPEAGSQDLIRHVYLPPLRDAKRALASGNPTRIHALLNHFLGAHDPDDVAKTLARTSDHPILSDVDCAVSARLEELTAGVRRQEATLGFNKDERLLEIARDLRFKLADYGIAPEDLKYSGHGYANLLYMATIAVELERTDDVELTLFLVEEPEAHLHPQLQAAVLSFLEEKAEQSLRVKEDASVPAGHLQVVVATHSPNLSAWVPNERIVFVRSVGFSNSVANGTDDPAPDGLATVEPGQVDEFASHRLESRCIPLAKLNLDYRERRKIDRYLDVTKSALLFGSRVLLVEGIAEALLLPVIAKHHVLRDLSADYRVFRSAVFVPIDGVDFSPYAKVLVTPYRGVRVADRVVIVTDGDKHIVDIGEASPGQKRKSELNKLAVDSGAKDVLHVCMNTYSLEAELVTAGNAAYMKEVYLKLHPQSDMKWDEAIVGDDHARAKAIQKLFENTSKGDFAQLLAEKIASSATFHVPGYLREAIEVLVR